MREPKIKPDVGNLVERLLREGDALSTEAADEIEKLRQELKEWAAADMRRRLRAQ